MTMRLRLRPLALALLSTTLAAPAMAAVFINELHYDNSNNDINEGIEVVATAGENLASYSIVLYNGATASAGTTYSTRQLPAGSAVSCGGTVSVASLRSNNLVQNGGNDGIALWIVEEDGSEAKYSFDDMARRSDQVARWLELQGIGRGDSVILMLGKKAKAAGGQLVLCGPSGMVKEIIEESGLDAFFTVYLSRNDLA